MFKAFIMLVVMSSHGVHSAATGVFPQQFGSKAECDKFVADKYANADSLLPDGAVYKHLDIKCRRDTGGVDA